MADITRAEVASLIGEEYGPTLIKAATQGSVALSAFPTVNMGTKTSNMPVLATVPEAEWVSDTDNTGVKPTGQATWVNKTLVAEEVAVIVPIHENTLDDATENILEELAALGGQSLGKKLDQAVLFGTDKPASWTSLDLLAAAVSAGQTFAVGLDEDDLFGSINQAGQAVADAGFDPGAIIARRGLAFQLRNLRDTSGAMLLTGDAFAGLETHWSRNGAWEPAEATAFIVDQSTVRIGVRQDVTVKLLDQATLTSGINLAEKDMVALRFKARFAYVLGNPFTPEAGAAAYGVAAVTPAGS